MPPVFKKRKQGACLSSHQHRIPVDFYASVMVRGQNHAVCPPQNIPIPPRPKLREKVVAAQGLLSVLFLFAQVVFSFVKLISVGRSRSPLQKVEKTRKSRGIPGFFQQSSRDSFAAESMRNPHSLAAGYSFVFQFRTVVCSGRFRTPP